MGFRKFRLLIEVLLSCFIFLLIGYEFSVMRSTIKGILKALLNEGIVTGINILLKEYISDIKIVMYTLILILVLSIVTERIVNYFGQKLDKRTEDNDSFYRSLHNYLISNEKSCYVVNGYWGVGKTYNVNKFLGYFLRYRNINVYKISCFGIENRQDILNEMKLMFENQDNTIKARILKIAKGIPLIGEGVYNILKSSYDLKDIKKGSIFVFDDFERISYNFNGYAQEYYKSGTRSLRDAGLKELNDIQEEFKKVEKGFRVLQNGLDILIEHKKLEKYNLVTGLINELIDKYHMKVIILCNSDTIDNKYFKEIFEEKLECVFYKMKPKHSLCNSIAQKNLENIISLKDDKKDLLKKFIDKNISEISKAWKNTGIENARIFSRIMNSFINLVDELPISLDLNATKGIFYSIFIGNISYFYKDNNFNNIRVGENIVSFYRKYNDINENSYQVSIYSCLDDIEDKSYLIWYGENVSLSWTLGIHNNISKILSDVDSVKKLNVDIENAVANNLTDLDSIKALFKNKENPCIDDVLVLISKSKCNENDKVELYKYIFNNKNVNYKNISYYNFSESNLALNKVISIMNVYDMYSILINNIDLKEIIFSQLKDNFSFDKLENSWNRGFQDKDVMNLYKEWVVKDNK